MLANKEYDRYFEMPQYKNKIAVNILSSDNMIQNYSELWNMAQS